MRIYLIFYFIIILFCVGLNALDTEPGEHIITIAITRPVNNKEGIPIIIPLSEIFGEDFDYSDINLSSISLKDTRGITVPMRVIPVNNSPYEREDDKFPGNNRMLFSIPICSKKAQRIYVTYSEKEGEEKSDVPVEKIFRK